MANSLYPGFGGDRTRDRLRRLEVGAQRLQRGVLRPTSGIYARLPVSALDDAKKILDIRSHALLKRGSIIPTANTNGFAYVADTTTIHWYWDGTNGSTVIVLTRADGTKFVIPPGDILVTGLSPNTKYYFIPFWSKGGCNVGWVDSSQGTPAIATAGGYLTIPDLAPALNIKQNLQDREPLAAGAISGSTTAAGSVSAGAGDGGDPTLGRGCVMAGTEIFPLGGLPYELEVLPEYEWVRIEADDGRVLVCTRDHPLFHEERGRIEAEMLSKGDPILMDDGVHEIKDSYWLNKKCSKYKVCMAEGHLFYANGFLSHNVKINTR